MTCAVLFKINNISGSGVTAPSCIVLYCIVFVLYLYCICIVFVLYLYCICIVFVLYCIVLHCVALCCIVLHCIVLETKIMFMLYLFNQMILPFPFSSVMFVQEF